MPNCVRVYNVVKEFHANVSATQACACDVCSIIICPGLMCYGTQVSCYSNDCQINIYCHCDGKNIKKHFMDTSSSSIPVSSLLLCSMLSFDIVL